MSLSKAKKKLVGRLRSSRMRSREELVLVEGPRAVRDVLEAEAPVRFALITESFRASPEGHAIVERLDAAGHPVEGVSDAVLAELADTESPQGILMVCAEPRPSLPDILRRKPGRFLFLDGVQDPGNAGTLIRAARAFALDGVVALDGTVDPWNPKAVRAAAGSSFHIPVLKAAWGTVEPVAVAAGIGVLVAEAGGTDVHRFSADPPWALVVGNEGRGVRDEIRETAEAVVTVTMPGGAESLNVGVAGAILLHVLARPTGSGERDS